MRDTRPPYLGSCLCGKVRFHLKDDPWTFYACHCTDCRRRTGGAMLLAMWVDRAALEVLHGHPELKVSELREGRERRSRVCPNCATRLWAEPADKPNLAILRPGTLENLNEFEPVAHLYTRSALPWVIIPEGVARYETQPNDPRELVRLWQEAASKRASASAA
jgi:hypothetical protein